MTMGFKKFLVKYLWIVLVIPVLLACNDDRQGPSPSMEHEGVEEDFQRGPNSGRLLESGNFTLELAIFETGVPPEFHAWATIEDNPLSPAEINLTVILTRLGNVTNTIHFTPQGEYLRGDTVVYEPHSFVVSVAFKCW